MPSMSDINLDLMTRDGLKNQRFLYGTLFLVFVHEATPLMVMSSTCDSTTRIMLKILQITSSVIIIEMSHPANSLAGIE